MVPLYPYVLNVSEHQLFYKKLVNDIVMLKPMSHIIFVVFVDVVIAVISSPPFPFPYSLFPLFTVFSFSFLVLFVQRLKRSSTILSPTAMVAQCDLPPAAEHIILHDLLYLLYSLDLLDLLDILDMLVKNCGNHGGHY